VRTAEDLDRTFSTIIGERAQALLVLADRVFLHNRTQIVAFARRNGPALSALTGRLG